MLGTLFLLVCIAAIAVAAVMVFVAIGPVPVNRRVDMVSRITPLPTAAAPIVMPGMPVFDPAQATFTNAHFTPPQAMPIAQSARMLAHGTPAPDDHEAVAALEPPRPAPRKAKPLAPIAPTKLRRPRTAPSPLPRTRSARGTEPPRSDWDIEHTAAEPPLFDADELLVEEPTFYDEDYRS